MNAVDFACMGVEIWALIIGAVALSAVIGFMAGAEFGRRKEYGRAKELLTSYDRTRWP